MAREDIEPFLNTETFKTSSRIRTDIIDSGKDINIKGIQHTLKRMVKAGLIERQFHKTTRPNVHNIFEYRLKE